MLNLTLPVRFYGSDNATLALDVGSTAVMVVDANGGYSPTVITDAPAVVTEAIAPVLRAARSVGMRVFYFHEDGYGTGGPFDITRELHGTRHGRALDPLFFEPPQWVGSTPAYHPAIAPAPDEADFPKSSKDGFQSTNADYYLRSRGITTLLAVGFALRSCLYHTCMGARHHNYRVVLLRDCTTPPGDGEFPDTRDSTNAEGGWMRFVFLRQFETNIGYSATGCGETLKRSDGYVRILRQGGADEDHEPYARADYQDHRAG
jgi:nicotinamidase-related amidase